MKPSRRPRILIVTMYYLPEPNFITADVARALTAVGKVTVVTAHPSYPFGHFYPGTKYWMPTRSVEDGVTVWRIPCVPDHSRSVLRRGVSYLSFALLASVIAPLVAGRVDVVWVYHGQFLTALAALWHRFVGRARLIVTIADLWPESLVASGVLSSGLVLRAMFLYRQLVARTADVVIGSTRGTVARCATDGVPSERLRFIPVWVDGIPDSLSEQSSGKGPDLPRNIVYAGNLGPAQNLETVVRAAAILLSDDASLRFDLYGAGSAEDELKALARDLGTTNVVFHGRVSAAEAFRHSEAAFAQIVCLRPSPLFEMTIPSKLAFALAAGSPILYGLLGESAAIAAESGAGVPFDSTAPQTLVAAIRRLDAIDGQRRADMRDHARNYFERWFAKSNSLSRYLGLFREITGPSSVRKSGTPS